MINFNHKIRPIKSKKALSISLRLVTAAIGIIVLFFILFNLSLYIKQVNRWNKELKSHKIMQSINGFDITNSAIKLAFDDIDYIKLNDGVYISLLKNSSAISELIVSPETVDFNDRTLSVTEFWKESCCVSHLNGLLPFVKLSDGSEGKFTIVESKLFIFPITKTEIDYRVYFIAN